jgi:aconitase A
MTDTLPASDGTPFRFTPPTSTELPPTGFTPGNTEYLPTPSPKPDPSTPIKIDPKSSRLELLEPFDPHFSKAEIDGGKELELKDLRCLIRVRGKCTTDEISAAGAWLKYKGTFSSAP